MRSRSTSLTVSSDHSYGSTLSIDYTNFPQFNSKLDLSSVASYVSEKIDSSISDSIVDLRYSYLHSYQGKHKIFRPSRAKVLVPKTLRLGSRARGTAQALCLPVHRCIHTHSRYSYAKNISVNYGGIVDGSSELNSRRYNYLNVYPCAGSLLGIDNLGPEDFWNQIPSLPTFTAVDCPNHDWFALQDQFNEAFDSFVPQSFFVGEDIAEHDVFSTAFKLVLNPTRAIPTLIKAGIKHVKGWRRKNLGHIASELSRDGANGFLSYNFAIKPAISDIQSAIASHHKVSQRMQFLISHRGRYVPVRVMRSFERSPDFSNPGPMPSGESSSMYAVVTKRSTARLGCWAKVREDLTYNEIWKAYLEYFGINKIVGLAWELIPFSFIVDWFTNAQERINSLTRIRTGGPFTELLGFFASTKEESTTAVFLRPGFNHGYGFPMLRSDPFEIASKTSTSYNRYPTIPDTSGVVDISTLGLFHSFAGASLIIQRALK